MKKKKLQLHRETVLALGQVTGSDPTRFCSAPCSQPCSGACTGTVDSSGTGSYAPGCSGCY